MTLRLGSTTWVFHPSRCTNFPMNLWRNPRISWNWQRMHWHSYDPTQMHFQVPLFTFGSLSQHFSEDKLAYWCQMQTSSPNWRRSSLRSAKQHIFQFSSTFWEMPGFLGPNLRLYPWPRSLQESWRKRALFTPPMKDSGNRYMLVDVSLFIGKKVKARKSFGLCLKSHWCDRKSSYIVQWIMIQSMTWMKNASMWRTPDLTLKPSNDAQNIHELFPAFVLEKSQMLKLDQQTSLEEWNTWRMRSRGEHGQTSDEEYSPRSPWQMWMSIGSR